MKNTLKVLYILLAGAGVFLIGNIWILLGVIGFHAVFLFFVPTPQKAIRALWKVKWFLLLIFIFHTLSFSEGIALLSIKKWTIYLNESGLGKGSLMAAKLIAMLLLTQVVRLSIKDGGFVEGMHKLGLSRNNAEIIDQIMSIVTENTKVGKEGGGGSGGGKGKGKNRLKSGEETASDVESKDVLLKGKTGNLPLRLLQKIDFAKDRFNNNPNAIVASTSLAVTLIRLVKIAPGLPLAPGHKNILLMPVLIYGIAKAKKPFTGLQVGFISGILHFSLGFGKYGPLGILQFAFMGVVLDLLFRIPGKKNSLWFLMLVGGIGGLTRIFSEILLAIILGMPNTFFLVYLPYIISQVAFGAASGLITKPLLKNISNE